jgi:hypothetical protein
MPGVSSRVSSSVESHNITGGHIKLRRVSPLSACPPTCGLHMLRARVWCAGVCWWVWAMMEALSL